MSMEATCDEADQLCELHESGACEKRTPVEATNVEAHCLHVWRECGSCKKRTPVEASVVEAHRVLHRSCAYKKRTLMKETTVEAHRLHALHRSGACENGKLSDTADRLSPLHNSRASLSRRHHLSRRRKKLRIEAVAPVRCREVWLR